jgi:integrase/recombinase XerD
MRVGEIAGLKHYDLANVCLSNNGPAKEKIRPSKGPKIDFYSGNVPFTVFSQIQLRKRSCKGKHARSVHLSTVVKGVIVDYFDHKTGLELSDPLCNGYKGQMSNVTLSQNLWTWYRQCGLYGASSHSGRRGFVTGLLEKKVNIKTVQVLVGHRQLTTTQLYADTMEVHLKEAVEVL